MPCAPSASMVPDMRCLVSTFKDNWCIRILNFVADMLYNKVIIVKMQPCDKYLPFPKGILLR